MKETCGRCHALPGWPLCHKLDRNGKRVCRAADRDHPAWNSGRVLNQSSASKSVKTIHAMLKGFEVMHALKRSQITPDGTVAV